MDERGAAPAPGPRSRVTPAAETATRRQTAQTQRGATKGVAKTAKTAKTAKATKSAMATTASRPTRATKAASATSRATKITPPRARTANDAGTPGAPVRTAPVRRAPLFPLVLPPDERPEPAPRAAVATTPAWQPPPPPPPPPAWSSAAAARPDPTTWEPPIPTAPYTSPPPVRRGPSGKAVGIAVAAVVAVLAAGAGIVLATGLTAPSKAEYASKADAICTQSNAAVTGLSTPSSYPELATASGSLADATNGQVTELRTLERPSGGAGGEAEVVLGALAATGQSAQGLEDSAGPKNDVATVNATKDLSAAFSDANAKAKAFGLSACAVGMQSGVDAVTGGSKTIIKSGFVAKADALCRAGARQLDAIQPRNESLPELNRIISQGLVVLTKLQSDLEGLPVPPGDESTVSDMWAAQNRYIDKAKELQSAAAAADVSRLTAIDHEMQPLVTAADSRLDAYGLGICGSNFGEY